jgi:putative transposase
MRKSQYSEEQIIGILREAEGDTPVKVVCAKHNISDATFYKWRSKYGGMDVNEARRLRALEDENGLLLQVWSQDLLAHPMRKKRRRWRLVHLASEIGLVFFGQNSLPLVNLTLVEAVSLFLLQFLDAQPQ